MSENRKVISTNRKARHDYELLDAFEAGLVLTGSEIKSIRAGHVNLREGYILPRDGELWLINTHISSYDQAGRYGHDPLRPRKLLLHKREIRLIITRIRERGYTCVPTMVFLERGKAKVEIALAKGKKLYDKREAIAKRDSDREIRQAMKERFRE